MLAGILNIFNNRKAALNKHAQLAVFTEYDIKLLHMQIEIIICNIALVVRKLKSLDEIKSSLEFKLKENQDSITSSTLQLRSYNKFNLSDDFILLKKSLIIRKEFNRLLTVIINSIDNTNIDSLLNASADLCDLLEANELLFNLLNRTPLKEIN